MSRATLFVQHCPTCGRPLQVRVALLGKVVRCQHCSAEFCALGSEQSHGEAPDVDRWLELADDFLTNADFRSRG